MQIFKYWFKYGFLLASKCIAIDKFPNFAHLCDFVSCRLCMFKHGCGHNWTKHTDMRPASTQRKEKKSVHFSCIHTKSSRDFVCALEHNHHNALLFWFTALFAPTPLPLSIHTAAHSTTAAVSMSPSLSWRELWIFECFFFYIRWCWNEGSVIVKMILHLWAQVVQVILYILSPSLRCVFVCVVWAEAL